METPSPLATMVANFKAANDQLAGGISKGFGANLTEVDKSLVNIRRTTDENIRRNMVDAF